jgi:hypothetical protein
MSSSPEIKVISRRGRIRRRREQVSTQQVDDLITTLPEVQEEKVIEEVMTLEVPLQAIVPASESQLIIEPGIVEEAPSVVPTKRMRKKRRIIIPIEDEEEDTNPVEEQRVIIGVVAEPSSTEVEVTPVVSATPSRNIFSPKTPMGSSRKRKRSTLLSPQSIVIMQNAGRFISTPVFQKDVFIQRKKQKVTTTVDRPPIEKGITERELVNMYSVTELKQFCRMHTKKTTGSKQELAKRIFGEILSQSVPLLTSPMLASRANRYNPLDAIQSPISKHIYSDMDFEYKLPDQHTIRLLRYDSDPYCTTTADCSSVIAMYRQLQLYTPLLMKAYCRTNGISDTGNRQQLKRRILSYLESQYI